MNSSEFAMSYMLPLSGHPDTMRGETSHCRRSASPRACSNDGLACVPPSFRTFVAQILIATSTSVATTV